jgi:hypothetical protein
MAEYTEKEMKALLLMARSENLSALLPEEVRETLLAGLAKDRITRKFREGTATEKNVDAFTKSVSSLAAMVSDFIAPSGTSGDQRIALDTEHGKLTIVLSHGDE